MRGTDALRFTFHAQASSLKSHALPLSCTAPAFLVQWCTALTVDVNCYLQRLYGSPPPPHQPSPGGRGGARRGSKSPSPSGRGPGSGRPPGGLGQDTSAASVLHFPFPNLPFSPFRPNILQSANLHQQSTSINTTIRRKFRGLFPKSRFFSAQRC